MTEKTSFRGLIFDILHTLIDDSGFPKKIIPQFLAESGVKVDRNQFNQEYDAFGKSLFDWPNIHPFVSIRELHRQRLMHFYAQYAVTRNIEKDLGRLWEYIGSSKIYPDVTEILPKLRRFFKLGLLSNADKDDPLIRKLLGKGFRFDVILTSEEAGCYKPHPHIFEIMIEKMALKPGELLMIGDSPQADIVGAHRAGIAVAWINRQKKKLPPGINHPTYEFSNLNDLWQCLKPIAVTNEKQEH
ncbi:MAG TPA: HAD family hydrolase [Bacteroidetes bacterium]|nr:HAD family hydrolase [Bacteroidota bacterium]